MCLCHPAILPRSKVTAGISLSIRLRLCQSNSVSSATVLSAAILRFSPSFSGEPSTGPASGRPEDLMRGIRGPRYESRYAQQVCAAGTSMVRSRADHDSGGYHPHQNPPPTMPARSYTERSGRRKDASETYRVRLAAPRCGGFGLSVPRSPARRSQKRPGIFTGDAPLPDRFPVRPNRRALRPISKRPFRNPSRGIQEQL